MDLYTALYLIGAFLIGVVVRHLMSGDQMAFTDLRQVIVALVEQAEQTLPGTTGKDKLAWVVSQCDEIGLTKYIPAPVLSALIESAVYRLRKPQQIVSLPIQHRN